MSLSYKPTNPNGKQTGLLDKVDVDVLSPADCPLVDVAAFQVLKQVGNPSINTWFAFKISLQ